MDPDETAVEIHDGIVDLMVEHGYTEQQINGIVTDAVSEADSQL